jgi:uncharacterized cupredoxin-like copper-binding protein
MVSFVLALFLVAGASMISAAPLASSYKLQVNGVDAMSNTGVINTVSVVAGSTMTVQVTFTANQSDTDVTFEVTLDGNKAHTYTSSNVFDVEAGKTYTKTLTMTVPSALTNEVSDDLTLSATLDGNNYKFNLPDYTMRVQRPSYDAVVESVTTPTSINAGDTIPVEIVLKNMGYNELQDLYVSAGISELNLVQGPKWFGDLTSLNNCTDNCNQKDTVVGDMYLTIPYSAKAGTYTLNVVVQNGDTQSIVQKQIVINNNLPNSVISTNETRTAKRGEVASYSLLLVNPTNNVVVYNIVADSKDVDSNVNTGVVAVPAGSSKTVTVTASSQTQGTHNFNVNVYSNGKLESTVGYTLNVTGSSADTVLVLTIILAIIFLALLVVLIVLLGRKPAKSEDLGESYY